MNATAAVDPMLELLVGFLVLAALVVVVLYVVVRRAVRDGVLDALTRSGMKIGKREP